MKVNDEVLWAGRRHRVLEVAEDYDMAMVGLVNAANKIEHDEVWWIRFEALTPLPPREKQNEPA